MKTITLTDDNGKKYEVDVSNLREVDEKFKSFARNHEEGRFELSIVKYPYNDEEIGFVVRGAKHLNHIVGEKGEASEQAGFWTSKEVAEQIYEELGRRLGK